MYRLRAGLAAGVAFCALILFLGKAVGAEATPLPLALRSPTHPYLFFTPEIIGKLRARIAREPDLAQAHRRLMARAESLLSNGTFTGTDMELLGFAFCVTRDPRYAQKVRELLLAASRKPNWGESDLLKRDPPWHAGLATARNCYAMAVGFDSVYSALTPSDRITIARGLVNLGIQPTLGDWLIGPNRIHSLDTMGHNWWSACVFSAGVGALAVLDEEPRAGDWLRKIADSSPEWFGYAGSAIETKPQTLDANGGLYEGVNYSAFAYSEYLLFRLAWTNAINLPRLPEIPALAKVTDYFVNMSYPNTRTFVSLNFGDGPADANGSRPLVLLWALGSREPRSLWYLRQTAPVSFKEGVNPDSAMGESYFPTTEELSKAPEQPDLPLSALFPSMGWATMRSSWDRDATLLAVKSGTTFNHSHADSGSFVLYHHGQYLLIDSGSCDYSRPEYDEYYRQSRAQNVALFNGEAENPEDTYFGSQFPGSLSHLIDTESLKYVFSDATGPTAHNFVRNFRSYLWIGDVILILDDLKSYTAGQFEWLLHYNGRAERKGLDLTVASGPAEVVIRPLFPETFPDAGLATDFPEKMRLVEKSGLKDHAPDAPVKYFAIVDPKASRATSFLTAIVLSGSSGGNGPTFERLQGTDMIGVRMREKDVTTDVYVNLLAEGRIRHRDACISAGGWQTDAYLTAISYPTGAEAGDLRTISRYFIADGSYLRRDGTIILDSLSKVFLVAEKKSEELDVQLQGQPRMRAQMRTGEAPQQVRLNGVISKVPFDAATSSVELSIPAGP